MLPSSSLPPPSVPVVEGDLLRSDATFVVHQCNCVTTRSKGLSQQMFQAYPYADIYASRAPERRDVPGTIVVCGNGREQRYVVNVLGQMYPGPSRWASDSASQRLRWFREALHRLAQHPWLTSQPGASVDFPDQIGCGLAGGAWADYYAAIQAFAQSVPGHRVRLMRRTAGTVGADDVATHSFF